MSSKKPTLYHHPDYGRAWFGEKISHALVQLQDMDLCKANRLAGKWQEKTVAQKLGLVAYSPEDVARLYFQKWLHKEGYLDDDDDSSSPERELDFEEINNFANSGVMEIAKFIDRFFGARMHGTRSTYQRGYGFPSEDTHFVLLTFPLVEKMLREAGLKQMPSGMWLPEQEANSEEALRKDHETYIAPIENRMFVEDNEELTRVPGTEITQNWRGMGTAVSSIVDCMALLEETEDLLPEEIFWDLEDE
ncbi:MAG: hypothetical protein IKZ87_01320 [Actinomycetaceae bacterium]|nr:hypothetical protein [Actinomycetaceae bacterium]